jgi:hypothetical protein
MLRSMTRNAPAIAVAVTAIVIEGQWFSRKCLADIGPARLLSAFYVEGYLSFSLPAILTGLVAPIAGLPLAADVYGAVVIVLALGSLLAMLRSG